MACSLLFKIGTRFDFLYEWPKMVKKKDYYCPVIWRSTHEKSKRRWRSCFALTHLFYLIIIASLGLSLLQDERIRKSFTLQSQEIEELKTKEAIYSILRSKGVSLSQGIDTAEVTMQQSRKLDLPMSLILAVMKKESMFSPFALSSRKAMGLMQIHPITWEEYVKKLNLNVSAHAVFDPVTNIIVASHVLKDHYDYYKTTAKSESAIWESALSAYYAGVTSLSQTGITKSHTRYVGDVNKFKEEYDERFKN